MNFFSKQSNVTPKQGTNAPADSDEFLTNIQAEANRFNSKSKITSNGTSMNESGQIEGTNKMSSFGSKLKTRVMFWKNEELIDSVSNTVSGAQNTAEKMQYGQMILGTGLVLLFFSTMYLPFVAIFPAKFCALFSLGSIAIMGSLGFMIGFWEFAKKLYSRDNLLYSITYTISLVAAQYFSMINPSYVFVIIFCTLEFVSLSYLLFANIPYGRTTLNFFYKTVYGIISTVCKCLCKKAAGGLNSQASSGGPILPI